MKNRERSNKIADGFVVGGCMDWFDESVLSQQVVMMALRGNV